MKQIRMSEAKLQGVIESFLAIIESIESDEVRDALDHLMDELGERFFECPAADRLAYHNCFVGGLAEHSLRVYGNLLKLAKMFAPELHPDSLILVALMHDLGKLGSVETIYYLPQESEWHMEKMGQMYLQNPDLEYLGTAQRSIRILGEFNVPMTDLEYKAILIHDGQYVPANKAYAHREGMLGLLLHQADVLACRMEQEKWKAIQ